MTQTTDRRSVRELLAAIASDLALLTSQLFLIARAEAGLAAGVARSGAMVAALGAGLLLFGAVTLLSAIVLILVALGMPPWAAALAVGVLLTLGGAVALHVGIGTVRHVRLQFPETREAITEGLSWLKSLQR